MTVWIGIDLAKKADYTALVSLNDDGSVINIARLKHINYTDQLKQIEKFISIYADPIIFVDASGPGAAVYEMIKELFPESISITITAGNNARKINKSEYNVSKKFLMNGLQAAFKATWLQIDCFGAKELQKECVNFIKKDNGKLEAGEGHDDLVLALALALLGKVLIN